MFLFFFLVEISLPLITAKKITLYINTLNNDFRKKKAQKYKVRNTKTTFLNYIFPIAIRVAVSTLSLQQTDNN